MKKSWTSSKICENNWWIHYRLRMQGCLCESGKSEVGKEMFARGRSPPSAHKNTLRVPSFCVGGRPQLSVEPLGLRPDGAIKKHPPPESACVVWFCWVQKEIIFDGWAQWRNEKISYAAGMGWHHFFFFCYCRNSWKGEISCTINFRTSMILSKSKE